MSNEAGVDDGGARIDKPDASAPNKIKQKQTIVRLDAGAEAGATDASVLVDAGEPPVPKHELGLGGTIFSSIFGLACCFGPLLPIIGIWAAWKSVLRSRSSKTKIIRDVTRPFR